MDERSNVGIANLALVRAGASKLIADLETDKTPEAAQLRVILPQYRDELLESFRWPFATRRALLAELETERTDWTHVYAAPADMLTAKLIVTPGTRNPRPEDGVPFELEAGDAPANDEDGEAGAQVILTDQDQAELVYVCRITNPARFSALFAGALAWRLAIDAAIYLTKKADLATVAQREFVVALERAKVHAANQRKSDPPLAPDFLEGYEGVPQRFKTALE